MITELKIPTIEYGWRTAKTPEEIQALGEIKPGDELWLNDSWRSFVGFAILKSGRKFPCQCHWWRRILEVPKGMELIPEKEVTGNENHVLYTKDGVRWITFGELKGGFILGIARDISSNLSP